MLKKTSFYFSFLFLFLFSTLLKAQKACFEPSSVKGCAPFTVTLDENCAVWNSTSNAPRYYYDYLNLKPGERSVIDKQHTYDKAGVYTIYQFIGTDAYDTSVVITVFDPTEPNFSLKSCIGGNVLLTSSDVIYDKFEINWGDGTIETIVPTTTINHHYTTDGKKSVSVKGIFLPNVVCSNVSKSIYAFQSLVKSDFTELKVLKQHATSGEIQLSFEATVGQQYNIERSINGSAFDTLNTVAITTANSGTQTYIDKNLNTQSSIYAYRIVTFDDCVTSYKTDPIYSIIIKATPTETPALNTITWQTDATSVSSFSITKNGTSPQTPTTATSFLDKAILCGSEYCYNLTALLNNPLTLSGNPRKSISIDTCIVAKSKPSLPLPSVEDLNSTMDGNTVNVNWKSAGSGNKYNVFQSVDAAGFVFLNKQTTTSASYSLSNLNSNYCFQVDYTDACGNDYPKSSSTCPVILRSTLTGTTITLNWSAYKGFGTTGVNSYVVQKIDENNTVISEKNVGAFLTSTETIILTDPYVNFRIKVIPTNATLYSNSFSNNNLFKFEPQVFVPDIFTPNGDNSNEFLMVQSRFINSYSISIFSRWGEIVYSSKDITEGWNGYTNFVYAPEGAYTYKIIATDVNNKEFIKTGTITLAR